MGILEEMDKRISDLEALVESLQTLEIQQKSFKAHTKGWEEGFSSVVRERLHRMDERIAKLLESDDSADFEIKQWIEEMQALRKDVKAMEKRLAEVEARRFQPIVIHDRTPEPKPSIPTTWPYSQPPVIWGEPNPDPFKFTCQMKEDKS